MKATRLVLFIIFQVVLVLLGLSTSLKTSKYVSSFSEINTEVTLEDFKFYESVKLIQTTTNTIKTKDALYQPIESNNGTISLIKITTSNVKLVAGSDSVEFCGFVGFSITDNAKSILYVAMKKQGDAACVLYKIDDSTLAVENLSTSEVVAALPQKFKGSLYIVLKDDKAKFTLQKISSAGALSSVGDLEVAASFSWTVIGGAAENVKDNYEKDNIYLAYEKDAVLSLVKVTADKLETTAVNQTVTPTCTNLQTCFLFSVGGKLYTSDGTAVAPIKDSVAPKLASTWFKDVFYFVVKGQSDKNELFKSDGTKDGTKAMVAKNTESFVPSPRFVQSDPAGLFMGDVNQDAVWLVKADEVVVGVDVGYLKETPQHIYDKVVVYDVCDIPTKTGQEPICNINRYDTESKKSKILISANETRTADGRQGIEERIVKVYKVEALGSDNLNVLVLLDREIVIGETPITKFRDVFLLKVNNAVKPDCDPQRDCNGRGTCNDDDDSCKCFQDAVNGYWGGSSCNRCSSPKFDVNQGCKQCVPGYYGDQCDGFKCFGIVHNNTLVCNRHGSCVDVDKCVCERRYYGQDCKGTSCYGIDKNDQTACSGHGTCVEFNTCQCDARYSGFDCGTWNQDDYVWILVVVMSFGFGFLIISLLVGVAYLYRRKPISGNMKDVRLDDMEELHVRPGRGGERVVLDDEDNEEIELDVDEH